MTDADAPAVIALVEAAYGEYPGCVLDLPGVDADLPHLATRLQDAGGQGWVVVDDGHVVGCVGLTPTTLGGEPAVELKRLYIAASHRRRGLGQALVRRVEEIARRHHEAAAVDLWSDSRFTGAHRLYERCGYERQLGTRALHDPSDTIEYHFVHRLDSSPT